MLEIIKTQLYELLISLGYNVVDNRDKQQWPCLLLRTGAYKRVDMFDTRIDQITLTIDIFSNYKGEKEIIEIAENISNHIQELRQENPYITAIAQYDLKILVDKSVGVDLEHGCLSYQFILASGLKEVEDETTNPTGD